MTATEIPWGEWPLAFVTLVPTRKADLVTKEPDFDRFTQIGVLRAERFAPVDSLISSVRHHTFTVCDLDELSLVTSESYKRDAPRFSKLVEPLVEIVDGAIPVSLNPTLVKKLLHSEFSLAERALKVQIDRTTLFALRPKSRWIDLGLWRRAAGDAKPWPSLYSPPEHKLAAMMDRMKVYSTSLVDRSWTVKRLMEWQESQA